MKHSPQPVFVQTMRGVGALLGTSCFGIRTIYLHHKMFSHECWASTPCDPKCSPCLATKSLPPSHTQTPTPLTKSYPATFQINMTQHYPGRYISVHP